MQARIVGRSLTELPWTIRIKFKAMIHHNLDVPVIGPVVAAAVGDIALQGDQGLRIVDQQVAVI